MDQVDHAAQPATGEPATGEPAAMLKQFVKDFRGFQDRIETKLKTQDDRIALVDRKAAAGPRPALGETVERAPEAKALSAYLRHGDESGLRAVSVEGKSLVTTDDAQGGFLVDATTSTEIASVRRAAGSIRSIANVVTVEGGVYDALIDRADLATAWVTEATPSAETAASTLARISITLHELAAMPKASQRLLEDSAFDVERWLAESIAETFARAESAAFINGDGVTMPKGLLSYELSAAGEWGKLGYVATGVAGGFDATDPANDLIDLIYAVGARYRANGAFVMNSKTAGAVRKLKDVDGRFLWGEGLCVGEPARLCGHPVVICEDMPDIATDATPIAFGDFAAAYTIAERPHMRVLRDPYSVKPHVQFYVSSRIGGAVVDFDAVRVLKFGVS